ncbi:MAG TPA: (2Fe-2S)-binding protein [Actinobacteria bacterium]|nr:(2Fe-2S)-binding protein [Actinomycetota bacterium]
MVEPQVEPVRLEVNGVTRRLFVAAHRTLLETLREDLGLTGTKHGCELGECGACTVLVDGTPTLSCLTLTVEVDGAEVVTIEGLGTVGDPHPLQRAFAAHGAAQCGYCTPAMILTAKALLDVDPEPTRTEIAEAIAGNMCRCTGYLPILEAIAAVAEETR